jgi:hypothetical protein
MRAFAILCVLACAACEATIGGGNDGTTDASTTGDGNRPKDGAPDAPAACFNGRVVYLNFEGVSLTKGTSDATQNRASWMNKPTGAAPAYRAGDGNRLTLIQQITDGITAQLSGFPVTVVRTRPATGPYVMIVFGGAAAQVGSDYGGAVNQLDCDDSEKSDVAWLSDNVGSVQRNVNFAVGAIGFGLGLTATSDPNGCMCGWANNCNSNNGAPCRLSTTIARDPAATQLCAGVTSQDEVAAFSTAFCE